MFAVGDLVVYGGEGVCRVESIGPSGLRYDGGDKTYYHLAPLYRSGTVMTPVDTAVMMRPIISRDRAMELIAALPQLPQEREAVHAGQHGVQHQQVVNITAGIVQPGYAVIAHVGGVALPVQQLLQGTGQPLFVLHDEYAHGAPPLLM